MKPRLLLFALLMIAHLPVSAEGWVQGFVRKWATRLDSMAVKGLDPRYIGAPEKPWQVIVQGNISQSDLKMRSVVDGKMIFISDWGDIVWEPRIKTDLSTYAGVWAGYRGYGVGYSRNVSGDKGSIFKLGATGGTYGVNLRIHKFHTYQPEVRMAGYMPEWTEISYTEQYSSPINVKLLTCDAYYFFNGKRFSYPAAYEQSVIQKRSAGSLMAGAMYYHSSMDYYKGPNAMLVLLMNDIGKMKQYQASLGGGYAYNWVPCQGLLVSGMAMVMLTAYNRLDVWRYNSKYRELAIYEQENGPDPDAFNMEGMSDEEMQAFLVDMFTAWPMEQNHKTTIYSRVKPVVDARLSLTYNLHNWFVSTNAQINNFSFKHKATRGSVTDWYVNASVGVRF